jgi:HTH-type transcriptional regulator/antitoxin HigA
MSRTATSEFEPDFVSLPGDTLQEVLDERGISQANLAERTGRPKKTINEIVQGKAAITPETALQLERVLGISAAFWNNLERNYRENLARIEERERLLSHVEWLDRVPCRAMIKKDWIKKCSDKVEQLREVLNFFGVASPNRWEEVIGEPAAAFRVSDAFEIDKGALTAWLRKGELEAQRFQCRPFKKNAFRQVLNEARSLTERPFDEVFPDLQTRCAHVGVAVVVVPELPKTRANGATQWLSKDKALIQLSFRYKREDVLWFTFFHEAGHILLHGKRQVFVDSGKFTGEPEEEQANRFAADLLIPQKPLKKFVDEGAMSERDVVRFARDVGVDPGIVVGRLQNDKKIKHSHLNGLRRAIDPEGFAEAARC